VIGVVHTTRWWQRLVELSHVVAGEVGSLIASTTTRCGCGSDGEERVEGLAVSAADVAAASA